MRRDEALLLDILIAARRPLKNMQGVSRSDFEKYERLQDAVTQPLEIIGEQRVMFQKNIVNYKGKFPGIR